MRVVRNIGYVRKRRRTGRIMVGIGLALIVSAILFTLYPRFIFFAYGGLIVGFLTFNGGMQQLAKWGRKPRNDEIMDSALSRLNDRYTLIHYPEFGGRRPEHVLVSPAGLFVLTCREISGRIRVNGRRWRKLGSPLGFFFGLSGPQLGNPTVENEQQIETIQALLAEENLQSTINGAIVFVHPNVEVEVHEETVPIVHVTELLEFIREHTDEVTLGSRERDELVEKLSRGDDLERSGATSASPRKRVKAA